METTIYYLATKTETIRVLANFFEKFHISLVPYEVSTNRNCEYLFILEPIEIKKTSFAISEIWKAWLWENHPHAKLIIGSYTNCSNSCALNVLNLPDDLLGWLHKLPAVKEYPLQEKRKKNTTDAMDYQDLWCIGLPLTGRPLKERARQFIKGHDEKYSLYYQAVGLRKVFLDSNAGYPEWNESQILIMAKEIKSRWRDYSEYFRWLPNLDLVDRMEEHILKIEMSLRNTKKIKADGQELDPSPLNDMIILTKDKILPYLFPEDYW